MNPAHEPLSIAESHMIAIRALAKRSQSSFELVETIYRSELSRLEPQARVTRYLHLVTSSRARDRLRQSERASAHS
jgi:Protein of unknown function (DUF3562)